MFELLSFYLKSGQQWKQSQVSVRLLHRTNRPNLLSNQLPGSKEIVEVRSVLELDVFILV